MSSPYRPSWATIDLDAIAHNAGVLAELVAPAALCAVVKADGYGHGSVDAAKAALVGGASTVAVALVEEAMVLRQEGVDAPILLLSEPTPEAMKEAFHRDITPTLYTLEGVNAAIEVARETARAAGPAAVQVKLDTGMHRVGCNEDELLAIVRTIDDEPELFFEGLWSHLSVADEINDPFNDVQVDRFVAALERLKLAGLSPRLSHLSNSAGAIAHPSARFDMVRCGIALYGYFPSQQVEQRFLAQSKRAATLTPALSLRSTVHAVRRLDAGERPSYGRVRELSSPSYVATVPLGYADGVSRRLQGAGAEVLIGGRRRPFAGTVTMDQVLIDCGDDDTVRPGDEVVFIGRQGNEEIWASEWAELLGTISYEVLCDIGPRVPRLSVGDRSRA